mmetsp:Transcript_14736/g.32558  ORF Transcript_14736/g.32558 Transcript_14736/m.32558 type:complete len:248 (+) Transcript_14736:463-1206(+)|eukprot:CAMPEP_0113306886 /NCGR_PEP_ID=MMETSP0010_2-20120614/5960_1 /TAXON_ID=216773 ORGANISM="Corethron hystrix, Strain 308" /NCGR_SAMPLE_ID=MMETSP0010_2 /ASSEMBLY_ACC=CAM_ASM_000155 /LENGTH=247 /DNA_ID=CAMNT_0000161647 /DNA_START=349 /DNA_END=1092 /DNA_ORIENTATION=+ /assembly_acc=CAM_ASM_000155
MKIVIASMLAAAATAFAPSAQVGDRAATKASMSAKADLESLAGKLNPVVKYYDPIGLADQEFWGCSNDMTIGWLRESEVKHGRIAMFAFVGYMVHANHITWPFAMTLDGAPFPQVDTAPEAWDAIPEAAKYQIIAFVGCLEYWRESQCEKHYMSGGKIGEMPPFGKIALSLYDPFGGSKVMSAEKKEQRLVMELNNGRLAMIGIFGFLAEGKIEGSVPGLGFIKHYDGDFMAPFAKSVLPAVSLPSL